MQSIYLGYRIAEIAHANANNDKVPFPRASGVTNAMALP